ncbi:MAG: type II toxin-antitoxin system YafQ family toxin [Desulfovibrio sp.]|jgi:mRNA interferase YafQ|nr:type II toxin-antitoxin system YafQ family toxin [Desulfovibrio sp.]
MLTLKTTARFRKDYQRTKKRGLDLSLLETVIETLLAEKSLDPKHRDHALSSDYAGFRECHVLPDWLLIYRVDHDTLVLTASRTGTHSDLFD